jgi:hypothetical protein
MVAPDAWFEHAYISIADVGGADTEFRAKVTSFSDGGAGYDLEGIDTFGGKITRLTPHEDIELSFDVIPVLETDFDTLFYGANITAGSGALTRTQKRVTMLWTDSTTTSAATEAIASGSAAHRRVYAGAYMTGYEPEFAADDFLKASVTFKLPPVDKDNDINVNVRSVTNSALTSLSAYTTSNKF